MPYLWGYRTVRSRGKANAHKVSEGGTGTADHKADSLTVYYSDSRLTSFFFPDFKGTTGGLLVTALVCCPSTKQNSSTNSLSRYSILIDFLLSVSSVLSYFSDIIHQIGIERQRLWVEVRFSTRSVEECERVRDGRQKERKGKRWQDEKVNGGWWRQLSESQQ